MHQAFAMKDGQRRDFVTEDIAQAIAQTVPLAMNAN